MPFATHRPTAVLEAQTELGFAAWTYCTHDPLAEVLKPNCFAGAIRMLRPGDPIVHGTNPQPSSSPWRERAGEVRRALLMVAEVRPGRVTIRLVQDYGRPEDASTPLDAPEHGRAAEADGARVDDAAANVTPLRERGRKTSR